MGIYLQPCPGYPFALDVQVQYQLGDDGLSVRTTATNVGDSACPYGCGQHPYLSPGDGLIDTCRLELAAQTRTVTDRDRQLPSGTESVGGTAFDLRRPRRLGDLTIDYPFTDLDRDSDGLAWGRLDRPDGCTAELWVDRSYSVIELFSADTRVPPAAPARPGRRADVVSTERPANRRPGAPPGTRRVPHRPVGVRLVDRAGD